MTSQIDMIRILLDDPNLTITKLRTQGDGITVVFADPSMNTIAVASAEGNEWLATRNQANSIAIEPANPSPVRQFTDAVMYHVADRINRGSILSSGLKLGHGGNTILDRGYAGRVHLAVQIRDAFQFLHFQISKLPNYTYGVSPSTKFPKLFAEIDIFSVKTPTGTQLYDDHHFDGRGVWLDQAIPSEQLNLLTANEWHPLFKEMYPDDERFYPHCKCV